MLAHSIPSIDLVDADDARTRRLREALLWRIHVRFQTLTRQFTFPPLTFNFTHIAEPDRVLDDVAAAEDLRERLNGRRTPGDELHLPYWAELWDSAAGIAQWLVGIEAGVTELDGEDVPAPSAPRVLNPMHLANAQVLDLGCGMGLAGTVAAALGANVMLADLEPAALLFARLNSLPWRQRTRTRQLDWRRDPIKRRFDLIIGADILYERAQWYFLEPFWRAHLADGGTVVLGEPGRQTGDAFIPWVRERGWRVRETQEAVPTRERPIRLLILD